MVSLNSDTLGDGNQCHSKQGLAQTYPAYDPMRFGRTINVHLRTWHDYFAYNANRLPKKPKLKKTSSAQTFYLSLIGLLSIIGIGVAVSHANKSSSSNTKTGMSTRSSSNVEAPLSSSPDSISDNKRTNSPAPLTTVGKDSSTNAERTVEEKSKITEHVNTQNPAFGKQQNLRTPRASINQTTTTVRRKTWQNMSIAERISDLGIDNRTGKTRDRRYVCFAYGSNTKLTQMMERCGWNHETRLENIVGKVQLNDHEIRFTGNENRVNGVATIRKEAGSTVWGVVYLLNEKAKLALDKSEGYRRADGQLRRTPAYDCTLMSMKTAEGLPISCHTYVRNPNERDIIPTKEYLIQCITGAKEQEIHDFPGGNEQIKALEDMLFKHHGIRL